MLIIFAAHFIAAIRAAITRRHYFTSIDYCHTLCHCLTFSPDATRASAKAQAALLRHADFHVFH
jgi:hypothetical protein